MLILTIFSHASLGDDPWPPSDAWARLHCMHGPVLAALISLRELDFLFCANQVLVSFVLLSLMPEEH